VELQKTIAHTVYATNMTAFYMLGTPGNAYRQRIDTYGYIALASA